MSSQHQKHGLAGPLQDADQVPTGTLQVDAVPQYVVSAQSMIHTPTGFQNAPQGTVKPQNIVCNLNTVQHQSTPQPDILSVNLPDIKLEPDGEQEHIESDTQKVKTEPEELNENYGIFGNSDISPDLHSRVKTEEDGSNSVFAAHAGYNNIQITSSTTNAPQNLSESQKIKKAMQELPYHECDKCGIRFISSALLVKHQAKHTGIQPTKCEICGKTFGKLYNLSRHQDIETGPFKCKVCAKYFKQKCALKLHEIIHISSKVRANSGTPSKKINHHDAQALTNTLDIKTPDTNASQSVKVDLIDQCETNGLTQEKQPSYHECSKCGIRFISAALLLKHETKHTDILPVNCEVCGKTFKGFQRLSQHQSIDMGPFECKVCAEYFKQKCALRLHEKIHFRSKQRENTSSLFQKNLKCEICGKHFDNVHKLTQHRNIDSGPFKCEMCDEYFDQRCALKIHKRTNSCFKPEVDSEVLSRKIHLYGLHDVQGETMNSDVDQAIKVELVGENNPDSEVMLSQGTDNNEKDKFQYLRCEECGEGFLDPFLLQKHETKHEEHLKPFKCEICFRCFESSSELVLHMKEDTAGETHECKQCNKCFSHKCALKTHEKIHVDRKLKFDLFPDSTRIVRLYKCDICENKCYKSKGALNYHKRGHTGEKPYKCKKCDKCFTYKNKLKCHEKSHSDKKPYQCKKCKKCFKSASYLKKHDRLHTEKPYTCGTCYKGFFIADDLEAHERIHMGKKPFECELCDRTFDKKYLLKTHVETQCSEHIKRPFKCTICGKDFTKRTYLRLHLRTYTGEKPYQCAICGKCFSFKSLLNVHERGHKGEKPFKCKVCHKSFTRSVGLKCHETIHTGDKSFKCKVCNKGFSHPKYLKDHELYHKSDRSFKCNWCDREFNLNKSLMAHERRWHSGLKKVVQ